MRDVSHCLPEPMGFGRRVVTHSAQETHALGRRLAPLFSGGELMLLHGDLGAGKTCLVQGICAGLAVDDEVVSPTYTLVNTYSGRLTVHHLDFYRLKAEHDLNDVGVPEILDDVWSGHALGLVEWPGPLLPVLGSAAYLEILVTADMDMDMDPDTDAPARCWHLRGCPTVPAAWRDVFDLKGRS